MLTKDEPIVSTDQSKQIRLFLNSRKEPYSSAQVNGSHRCVIFSFPSDFSLGELTFSQLGKSTSVAAQGEVIVPSNVGPNLKFEVGESVKRYPELLRYFRDNEIGSIFISDLESRSPLLLPSLLRLKGLRGLKMQRLCLDNADVDSLDGFQALQYLAIHQCTVDGANLAKCKLLSKLHILNIERMQNITPVLKVLEKSKVLNELKLGYSKVSDDNLQSLAKMTEMRTLTLRGTTINDLDLRKLSSLPHLKVLDLDCCNNLTPAAIEILKEFKCLEDLTLPDALSTESNEAILKREIPRLQRF